MAQIELRLNNRTYNMACDDGQENRVRDLAAYVNERLTMISKNGGGQSEIQNFMLTTLVLADEIFDMRANGSAPSQHAAAQTDQSEELAKARAVIDQMIDKVEALSAQLEKTGS